VRPEPRGQLGEQPTFRNNQSTLHGLVDSAVDTVITADRDEHISVFDSTAESLFHFRGAPWPNA
jgi:hypothetical protein